MSSAPVGRSQDDVRRHNLAAVLGRLHTRGPATRTQLTRELGLNRSTIGDLVGGLVAAQLAEEQAPGASLTGRAGRPSLVVRPVPDGACVLAVHLDVHWMHVARVGLGCEVHERVTEPLAPGTAPRAAAARVAQLAEEVLGEHGARLVGVGVAVPGTVGRRDGVLGLAPNLEWADVPLRDLVAEAVRRRTGLAPPVSVANDADLGVLAERLRGAARGSDDVVYLCGTWGLGGGIITGGHPLVGRRGHAGEVGHIGVDPAGHACHCGSRGCWEAEASAEAWAAALDLDGSAVDVADRVLARLAAGGVTARRTRDKMSRSFARGLASTINVVDPDVVLLGAGLWARLWPELAGDVLPWLRRMVLPALRDEVDVRLAGLGADSTLVGAAELAFGPLLADPLGAAALPAPVAAR
ncbi:ROK family protein [Quadrisphaera sp. KR29]|uniref:ROK family protein n=1 Tax=Quadrisphaera sp. KR29 TaxID=3461391 RepID=UPI0040449A5C